MKTFKIILLLILISTISSGQWSTDPNVNNPICTASGDQYSSQIVSDQSGGAIIVWEDFRNGNNYDIYAQRISSTGVVLWSLDGVRIAGAAYDQTMPAIISDGNGGAIITWTDFRGGNYSDVYAQKISADGIPQWTSNGVAVCTAVNSQFSRSLVSDGNGGAIIVWQDDRDGTFAGNIYAQLINSSGLPVWGANGILICSKYAPRSNVAIASDGLGGAIISWSDYRNTIAPNTEVDLYAQRVDANGSVMWIADGIPVCDLAGSGQVYPEIINNQPNEVIITWQDGRNGNADIYIQRLKNDGSKMWNQDGVALCTATGLQSFPVLTADNSSGAIVTWQDYRSAAFDVYAQRIDVSGNVLWTTDGVPISAETDAQISPDITSDGQGGAIITWRDYRDNGNQDIYAQRIDNNGVVQWTINGIAVSVATTDQYTPAITTDGYGGAIITWWDYRNSSTADIYAQQVSLNGQLGVVTDVDDENKLLLSFNLEQNYPNPFNPSTKIRFVIPNVVRNLKDFSSQAPRNDNTFVTLKVYDVLGKEVATLVNEEKPAGKYKVEFNASTLPSGVYFYQLRSGDFVETKKMVLLR